MMIPKIVHYCWFGKNEMPEKVKYCIKSWEKYLSNYKIMLWNEENFDVTICKFTEQAYKLKKYAFVSDYVRIYALIKYGGIYLDTDIEVIKSFDDLLYERVILGLDEGGNLTALMASEKEHNYFKMILKHYNQHEFIKKDNSLDTTPNNILLQKKLFNYKYVMENKYQQLADGITIYPDDYFHAKSLMTGKFNVTNHTYAIHHHTLLWVSWKTKLIKFIRIRILVPILGQEKYENLVINFKKNGEQIWNR